MDELGAAAEGSVATRNLPPPEGGGAVGPALGVELDYVGTLTAEQCVDLFRLAGLLRYVLSREGKTSPVAKKAARWDRLGALLALNDARRPTMPTLLRLADAIGVKRSVMYDIAAACPHAISTGGKATDD